MEYTNLNVGFLGDNNLKNNSNYSMLSDLRDKKLSTIYDKIDTSSTDSTMSGLGVDNKSNGVDWQSGAAKGAQAGLASGSTSGVLMGAGLGAALTPGAFEAGLMSAGTGGLGVAGAGLVLSQLEQKQKAKAMQEQAIAEEANNRKQQTMAALNNLMNQRVSVA